MAFKECESLACFNMRQSSHRSNTPPSGFELPSVALQTLRILLLLLVSTLRSSCCCFVRIGRSVLPTHIRMSPQRPLCPFRTHRVWVVRFCDYEIKQHQTIAHCITQHEHVWAFIFQPHVQVVSHINFLRADLSNPTPVHSEIVLTVSDNTWYGIAITHTHAHHTTSAMSTSTKI